MNKAIFLDRDGVLNRSLVRKGKPYAPTTLAEFEINSDITGLQKLRDAGYLLIVVTNQPDIANGLVTRDFVDQLHAKLNAAFPLDAFFVCAHKSSDACECRKPKPGMLLQAKAKYDIDFLQSFMVGDRWRDVLAGQAVGCKTVFIDGEYGEETPEFKADYSCKSLHAAIDWIASTAS